MANHKQALKRHRQSLKARARNRHYKTMLKNVVKKAASAEGDDKEQTFRSAESLVMRVASRGVIPKKRAARKIARLAKRVSANA